LFAGSHGLPQLPNVAVLKGESAEMVCPENNKQIIWREYVSNAMGTVIVHGAKVVKSKRMKRYQAPLSPYARVLYLPTVMPEDAGLYSCQKEMGEHEYFGQLLVLGTVSRLHFTGR